MLVATRRRLKDGTRASPSRQDCSRWDTRRRDINGALHVRRWSRSATLTKTYERGKQNVEVLHGIDLDIPEGDFVALMGPSGSGKTTLLNLIGGLDSPSGGELEDRRRAHRRT